MALSTVTIADTITWAKRLTFNRNPVIGNSLEPALSSANIIMQTILGPPFDWWWNSSDVYFTCDPTLDSATSSAVSISTGVMTVTAANDFYVGELLIGSNYGTLTELNGALIQVATANSTTFTANVIFGNGTDTTGTWTALTTQDYPIAVPTFSHVKRASVYDVAQIGGTGPFNPVKWYELKVQTNLALETSASRTEFIGPKSEDGNGNVTFRVFPAPDKPYPITLRILNAAPVLTSVNSTWAPIPDFMEYVYNWGFLALMWQFADDPRAGYATQKFTAALLSRAEGITEEERNIFLNNWDDLTARQGMKMQQGIQLRQV
jgi:hypothetical protein